LIVLGYSVLVAEGYKLCITNRPRLRIVAATFVVLLVLVNSHPVFLNQVYEKSQTYQIPSYYEDLRDWLTAQGHDFKVLPLPPIQVYESYEWGYSGPDILRYFSTVPILVGTSGAPHETPLLRSMFSSIEKDSNLFVSYARVLHIRYVLLDHSRVLSPEIPSTEGVQAFLQNTSGIQFLHRFGEISVFEVRDYVPIVYVPHTVYIVDESMAVLCRSKNQYAPRSNAIVVKEHVASEILRRIANSSDVLILGYVRSSPSTLRVQLRSSSPFILVVGVPYSHLWIARIDSEPPLTHFIINGFANAWIVEKPGTYWVDIGYNSESHIIHGVTISLTAAACMAVVIIIITATRNIRKSPIR